MKKTTQLKQMILSPQLEFLMEAHSGMSAKIVKKLDLKGFGAVGFQSPVL